MRSPGQLLGETIVFVKLKGSFTDDERIQLREFKAALSRVRDRTIICDGVEFSSERLKNMFKLYFGQESAKEDLKEAKFDLLALEYSLSQIFTARQKELLSKRLDGLSLTKSEREYYSRAVKKKVVALANQDLQRLAQRILERS
jgi:aldehyde:ferredoxin oxidoreductase